MVEDVILNSVDDFPALVDKYSAIWYNSGIVHRDQSLGPAEIHFASSQLIFRNLGTIHRTNGPAIMYLLTPEKYRYFYRGNEISMKRIREYDLDKPEWTDADVTLFGVLCF